MTAVYYNEFDPEAAAWLRALIDAGLLPAGDVDERSILEIKPIDLDGYSQCHFFAGIGGWPLALQYAGWPADRPVWTGSCPCQPFSVAGKRRGADDERHLWPVFRDLIAECRPPVAFGEQVASKDGRLWLAGVRADLEALGYAVGAADLCAAGIGAPHIRQRLYWVADGDSSGQRAISGGGRAPTERDAQPRGTICGVGDAIGARLEGHPGHVANQNEPGRIDARAAGSVAAAGGNRWGDNWIACADGKARRIEPGLSPLAHGIPARVVRLRGYGNAIVPQVAAEFIGAYIDIQEPHQP